MVDIKQLFSHRLVRLWRTCPPLEDSHRLVRLWRMNADRFKYIIL